MKLTKGVITRAEAVKLAPDYVKSIEDIGSDVFFDKVMPAFEKLKRGQAVLTYHDDSYIKAKVTSLNSNTYQAIDGPVVRVGNGEASWRVDGNHYAFPI